MDAQLLIRKDHGQKRVVPSRRWQSLLAQLARLAGAGRAVMSISNTVPALTKRFYEANAVRRPPDGVLNTILGGKVEQRLSHGDLHHHRIDIPARPVGEKHRSSLRSQHQHVPGAIVLLVAARAFVFLNQIIVVFIKRTASYDPDLFLLAHDQPVEINAGYLFGLERTVFDERVEILLCATIDKVAVGIGALG